MSDGNLGLSSIVCPRLFECCSVPAQFGLELDPANAVLSGQRLQGKLPDVFKISFKTEIDMLLIDIEGIFYEFLGLYVSLTHFFASFRMATLR